MAVPGEVGCEGCQGGMVDFYRNRFHRRLCPPARPLWQEGEVIIFQAPLHPAMENPSDPVPWTQILVPILALLLSSCVTQETLFNFSELCTSCLKRKGTDWGCGSMVECTPSLLQALGSIPSTKQPNQNKSSEGSKGSTGKSRRSPSEVEFTSYRPCVWKKKKKNEALYLQTWAIFFLQIKLSWFPLKAMKGAPGSFSR